MCIRDSFKSEHNAVDDGFGLGRAAGHVDVHGDHVVHAAHDVVAVLKHAARAGAGADGDDGLGFGHLVVKVFEDVLVALVHGAGDEQHVGVLGIADVHDAEAFDVEDGREEMCIRDRGRGAFGGENSFQKGSPA